MQTISELGPAIAARRRALGLRQGDVARQAGIAQAVLSRFEGGKCAEFGARKLLALLGVLGMELAFVEKLPSGLLDDFRHTRGGR